MPVKKPQTVLLHDSQGTFDRENVSITCIPADQQETRRRSIRCTANGIVALTNFEKPVVTNIFDISMGGVSFWSTNGEPLVGKEINMDILVYDTQANFEYLISKVKGQVRSRALVPHSVSSRLIRRFGIEFSDFDSFSSTALEKCYNMVLRSCSEHHQIP